MDIIMLIVVNKLAKGFTLLEVLIALAVNIVIFTALITFFSNTLTHYHSTLKINRLNQQLDNALLLMAQDIRRAGYWGNANSLLNAPLNTNPFMSITNGTDITIPSSSCILFTMDLNNDNTLPSVSANVEDERYGFRLNNQILQARPRGAAFDCAAAADTWENVTDPNIVLITNLNFVLNQTTVIGGGTHNLVIRSVDVTLTGQLATDPSFTKTLTQRIKVRNDRFTPP